MPGSLTRRTFVAGSSALAAGFALPQVATGAQATTYGAFRVVRTDPGEPGQPEIALPDGYTIVAGEQYSVASRAEYYTFVEGPASSDGIEVTVRWPGVPVETVIHQDSHLELRPSDDDEYQFTFTLPMAEPSADANQPTIQVWSQPDVSPGMNWRIEHNDADRVAGPWTTVPWPAGEVTSVIHQLVAAYDICRDSGIVDVAAAKGHRFVLMGFETNNTLHADNPPHWHIAYNSGPDFSSPTHLPHFWLDADGRNFYNGMDVTGLGRLKYYVGDPAPLYDFEGDANGGRGNLVVTITIREDGGLDITPAGGPDYAIAATSDGSLRDEVIVWRDGAPWQRIKTVDDVKEGVLLIRKVALAGPGGNKDTVLRYDRLTGVLLDGE